MELVHRRSATPGASFEQGAHGRSVNLGFALGDHRGLPWYVVEQVRGYILHWLARYLLWHRVRKKHFCFRGVFHDGARTAGFIHSHQ